MVEYITKEQAVDALKETLWDDDFDEFLMHYFELSIKRVKPADVAPAVHAEWIGTWGDGYADGPDGEPVIVYEEFECSRCGCVHHADGEPEWDYCPDCGARMDGGESDD